MSDEKDLEDLREYAAELGIEVKHQWGVPKLTEEIEKAEAEAASTLPPALKQTFSTFNGIAETRHNQNGAKMASIIGAADIYRSNPSTRLRRTHV